MPLGRASRVALAGLALLTATAFIMYAGPTRSPSTAAASVVGLGDSVPAGAACDCTDFVRLLATELAARRHVPAESTNLAVDGLTSAGLLAQLDQPGTAWALGSANLAVVTIGANDFDSGQVAESSCADVSCYRAQLSQLGQNLRAILTRVHAGLPAGSPVLVTGYWNVFLDGRVGDAHGSAYVANSDSLTRAVNRTIAGAAAATGAQYVDLYAPFKGTGTRDDTALLAADGDHPDAAGHRLIAAALLDTLAGRTGAVQPPA